MKLRIISAQDILFEGDVAVVHLPGSQGAFTVLPNHAAIISTLNPGSIVFRSGEDDEQTIDIEGGLVDVNHNVVSVLVS